MLYTTYLLDKKVAVEFPPHFDTEWCEWMMWDGDVMLVVLSAVRAVAGMGAGLVVDAREKGLVGVPRETVKLLIALGKSWGFEGSIEGGVEEIERSAADNSFDFAELLGCRGENRVPEGRVRDSRVAAYGLGGM